MSMSGVKVSDECKKKGEEIRSKHMHRFVLFKIDDAKTIVPEAEGEASLTYEDFLAALPENEPRYCLVDVNYTTKSGQDHKKLAFVNWCPDTCGVKQKMMYASSKDAIKKSIEGIAIEIQANDKGDVDKSEVQAKCLK